MPFLPVVPRSKNNNKDKIKKTFCNYLKKICFFKAEINLLLLPSQVIEFWFLMLQQAVNKFI